ncbi:MAG: hypothetical protein SWY16_19850 [Cyanobacteriota bacterium]|nr:hypothetical protein [Cyanobacteriota bacterium]
MQFSFDLFQLSAISIVLGIAIAPKIAFSQTQEEVVESNGINCYENVPIDGESVAIVKTFLAGEAIAFSDIASDVEEDAEDSTWRQVRLDDENSCWVDGNSPEISVLETVSLPEADERGNYPLNSSEHDRWEVTNRGLSGLNCYQTHPPNQGSHLAVARFFNGQRLIVAEAEAETPTLVQTNGRTWMAVNDPWSGQTCWVRAHEDFIKPIE